MSDKGEILSEAEVDFLLTAEKETPPASAPTNDGAQAVTMRGDLEQINLADIFQTLGMSKMEGVLRIRNPLEERQIYCRDGFLRVHVPARLATRRLGQRLVHAGLVQAEQLRTALVEQRKNKQPIGELLVERGLVAQDAIDAIVAGQVAEDLFALFTWNHGSFEFWKGEPNAELRATFDNCPEYEVNSLLLEVARRSDEWSSILDQVVSLDEIPARVREPEDADKLGDLHFELLPAVNGQTTYRQLAEQTTHGLFEVARAARDLVRVGIVANIDEATMVQVAEGHAETGQTKLVLVLLQTLRDRPGDRSLDVLQGMAKTLERCGERRLASSLLLEAAQRHGDADAALDLARAARALTPHDVGSLSFLRTVLVAHAPQDSTELEKVTLDLLDALIEADLVPTALEIIDDARRTGSVQPAILMREVRARQKGRDVPGATQALEELAQLHDARGERQLANEAYDALLRMDRTRKDVQKLLTARRRTRLGNIIRLSAAAAAMLMIAAMGIVFWQQHEFSQSAASADREINEMLAADDRVGARARLEYWAGRLGSSEIVDDLRSRVAFADAAEAGRQLKALRVQVNDRLAAAAAQLGAGQLAAAFTIYEELAAEARFRDEVVETALTRFDALLTELGQATKALQGRLPTRTAPLIDRADLVAAQNDLHSICRPALLQVHTDLEQLVLSNRLPKFVTIDRVDLVGRLLEEGRAPFARAKAMAGEFDAALARNDQQRQLDPVFKAAVEREREYDFAGALANYRELEKQPAIEPEMRAHFRDRVARNATIVRLLGALQNATTNGDFVAAQQQLRALRLAFPDVPFDTFVTLPLRVDSRPTGAVVSCDGKPVGTTPLLLPRRPADALQVTVHAEGFAPAERTIAGDEPAAWLANLVLPPDRSWLADGVLEVAPVLVAGTTIAVDRAGNVRSRNRAGEVGWTYRTGDLSGLLTRPVVHRNEVFFGSLDGDLRALDLATGEVRWTQADRPTEVTPLLVDQQLIVATTDRRLHVIDVASRNDVPMPMPQQVVALLRAGNIACALGSGGMLLAFEASGMRVRWQREVAARSSPQFCLVGGNTLVVADSDARIVAVDLANGEVRWQRQLDVEVVGAPVALGRDAWMTTRSHLLRFDGITGEQRAAVAPEASEWEGAATPFGERLVLPVRDGMQVVDPASGSLLYRLGASRKARVHVVGDELWLAEPDRTVHAFRRLR